jgi:hypothetical protein
LFFHLWAKIVQASAYYSLDKGGLKIKRVGN